MGKFEIYKDMAGEFRFRLKARNGEIILSSEGYTTKASCANGVYAVQHNCGLVNRYERGEAKNGKHYFNLKAANGQVIGTSQLYTSTSSCDRGIESVRKNGISTRVDLLD